MQTDWSALFKAVFGSAYATNAMSDLTNYPDVVSTSGCQQQGGSCRRRRVDQAPDVNASWPCDVTAVTSFTASGSVTSHHSFTRVSKMSDTPSRRSDEAVSSEGFRYKRSLQV